MPQADITKGYAHSSGGRGEDGLPDTLFIAVNLRADLYDLIEKPPCTEGGALKVLSIPGTNVCLFVDRVEK